MTRQNPKAEQWACAKCGWDLLPQDSYATDEQGFRYHPRCQPLVKQEAT